MRNMKLLICPLIERLVDPPEQTTRARIRYRVISMNSIVAINASMIIGRMITAFAYYRIHSRFGAFDSNLYVVETVKKAVTEPENREDFGSIEAHLGHLVYAKIRVSVRGNTRTFTDQEHLFSRRSNTRRDIASYQSRGSTENARQD